MGTVEWSIIAGTVFLVGTAVGFLLANLLRKTDSARLSEVEAELETYRGRVTEHFSQSAAHFQAIGRQYRELYEHMAEGSEKLCATDQATSELSFPRPGDIPEAVDRETAPDPSREAADSDSSTDEHERGKGGNGPKAAGGEQGSKASDTEETSSESATDKPDDESTLASADEKDVEAEKRLYH